MHEDYTINILTNNLIHRSEFDDEPIITKPDRIAGLKYSDYLNTLNWTDELKNRLQHSIVHDPHTTRCLGYPVRSARYPEITQEYVEANVCASANFVHKFSFSAFLIVLLAMLNNF